MGLDDRDYMRRPDDRRSRSGSRPRSSSSIMGLDGGLVVGFVLIGIALAALIVKGFNRPDPPDPSETLAWSDHVYGGYGGVVPLDINTATREELLLLPLVSERIADGMIARRPFRLVEELFEVKGIGEINIEIISMYLYGFEDQPHPLPIKPPGIPDA